MRDYTEQIRHNERQIMKPFSERSFLEKILIIAGVFIALISIGLSINLLMGEKANNINHAEEQAVTVYESGNSAVFEETLFVE